MTFDGDMGESFRITFNAGIAVTPGTGTTWRRRYALRMPSCTGEGERVKPYRDVSRV
jgi:hypothetical protein